MNNVALFGHAYVSSSVHGRFYDVGLDNVNINGKNNVGGLVGFGSYLDINNSYVSGNVNGNDYVGGLIGGGDYVSINNSYASGNVDGNDSVGGLIGDGIFINIDNSYASGNVNGSNEIGGLIGNGGSANISKSYSTGNVNGNFEVGSLVGNGTDTNLVNSYWNNHSLNPDVCVGGGTPMSEDCTIIQNNESYFKGDVYPKNEPMTGWAFFDIWEERIKDYPSLTWRGLGGSIEAPNISSIIDINESGVINGTVIVLDNVTINVTLENDYGMTVWVKVWESGIGISPIIYEVFLNSVDGIWSVTFETNYSFLGDNNYTVYVNNSLLEEINESGEFLVTNNIYYSKFSIPPTSDFNNSEDITNICNATLAINGTGRIDWNNCVNATGLDFDNYVNLGFEYAYVDSSNLHTSFNSSANITLYNIGLIDPIILKDGLLCDDCARLSFDGQNITFNVTGFSNYTIVENTSLIIFDENDALGGSAGKILDEQIKFFANYTLTNGTVINSTNGGNCSINFTDSDVLMVYNSTSLLWKYNRTFGSVATYDYNVSCNSSFAVSNFTLNDDVIISVKLDYSPKDNFIVVQLKDPDGFLFFNSIKV